ncbi:unnamed protein product [Psylliodes chrysocephalus]|uniref:Uncharacterized protein n=1 Tax=Psylliodes chrysocephalus TaxID=3402493 RepID=A0A9P0D4P1_9CUCU|nr:unnamed protein product [Psylliodes chrysocephala]
MALYILCHAGQIIQDGTESIGMAAYNSNWYSVDIDTQKDVLFIIRQCQKPSYLQALPLGEFNHSLMLMILKTSYSFLTFLTQTT